MIVIFIILFTNGLNIKSITFQKTAIQEVKLVSTDEHELVVLNQVWQVVYKSLIDG